MDAERCYFKNMHYFPGTAGVSLHLAKKIFRCISNNTYIDDKNHVMYK